MNKFNFICVYCVLSACVYNMHAMPLGARRGHLGLKPQAVLNLLWVIGLCSGPLEEQPGLQPLSNLYGPSFCCFYSFLNRVLLTCLD